MVDFNQIILSGRLVGDAEVRMTKSGKKLTYFSIAVNDDYKAGEEWVNRAYFFNVVYVGEKELHKADVVVVEGKITQNKIEKENQPKVYFQIVANKVALFTKNFKKEQKPNSEYVTDSINDEPMPF